MTDPTAEPDRPQWQITIEVPLDLPVDQRHELFSAIGEAVGAWEPMDRDGWDAIVCGQPGPAAVRDTEMEQLREYAGTARHHQQQHAEAWREVVRLRAELATLRERAVEVQKYWRDWPCERRDKVRVLSQFLGDAIDDLATLVESWRPAPEPATPPKPTEGEEIHCGKHVLGTSSNRCLLPRGHDVHDDDPQQPEPVSRDELTDLAGREIDRTAPDRVAAAFSISREFTARYTITRKQPEGADRG